MIRRGHKMWGPIRALGSLAVVALLLSGCSEVELVAHGAKQLQDNSVSKELGEYKVGKPYQVRGVWYYPSADYDYDETGIASWYGPGFHGKRTANGAIFDENKVSAAHKTLPLPSVVRVTNLENGRSIKVLVNDRGPFAEGRIIDLSRRAAQLLDTERSGTARVRVQILETDSRQVAAAAQGLSPDNPQPEAAPTGTVVVENLSDPNPVPQQTQTAAVNVSERVVQEVIPSPQQPIQQQTVTSSQLFVQAGAFSVYDNADRLRSRLSTIAPASISPALVEGTQFYRVRLGPLGDVDEADMVLARLISSGYTQSRIVVD
jgi:rare lipoprotein A